ncbi:hypothetical protein [Maribacter sp. 2210JD10-5]|uniref:hypothetical protein n=1 Tax=Maribacter sp. 2210JD10-5 TaxID=3386272 RepID=UPI0039BCEF5D
MKCAELNKAGNFDTWQTSKLEELKTDRISDTVSDNLIFENNLVKLWMIFLLPQERLPFRKKRGSFSWTCLTGGLAISRYANGKISLLSFDKGDTSYLDLEDEGLISDLENIGEHPLEITVVEHLKSNKWEMLQNSQFSDN